jgi:hypothetical protein
MDSMAINNLTKAALLETKADGNVETSNQQILQRETTIGSVLSKYLTDGISFLSEGLHSLCHRAVKLVTCGEAAAKLDDATDPNKEGFQSNRKSALDIINSALEALKTSALSMVEMIIDLITWALVLIGGNPKQPEEIGGQIWQFSQKAKEIEKLNQEASPQAREILLKLERKAVECGADGNCLLHSIIHQGSGEGQLDDSVKAMKAQRARTPYVCCMREFIVRNLKEDIAKLESLKNLNPSNSRHLSTLKSTLLEINVRHPNGMLKSVFLPEEVAYYLAKYYNREIFIFFPLGKVASFYSPNMKNIADGRYKMGFGANIIGKSPNSPEVKKIKERISQAICVYAPALGHFQALDPVA